MPVTAEMKPRISVIIPHLNTPELLVKCLQSLIIQKLDHGWFEIIVVDNGSHVPLDALSRAWPDVIFLEEHTPGPGPARNLGVRKARADILAFIDADCRAGPGWLQAAAEAVESRPDRPVGGDVRVDFRNPDDIQGIEAFEAVFSFRQKMYIRRRNFSGAGNLACTRELFALVGDFCGIEKSEDMDWGQRATAAGHAPYYMPHMRVYHPARTSFVALQQRWQRFIAHNWNARQKTGLNWLKWQMQAWAVLFSPAAHLFWILFSSRIPGFRGRMRALPVLFSIRTYRFREMQRVARLNDSSSAQTWNRA